MRVGLSSENFGGFLDFTFVFPQSKNDEELACEMLRVVDYLSQYYEMENYLGEDSNKVILRLVRKKK